MNFCIIHYDQSTKAQAILHNNHFQRVSAMPKTTIHPPGDKMKKAILELSELLAAKPEKNRRQLLEKVAIKFDLSPNECAFLERHFKE